MLKYKITILTLLTICLNGFSQDYVSPFDFELKLSGTFGELRNNHFHAGIDIKTNEPEGHPIYSIADGYVSRIKVSTWGYGKTIYINHPDGNTSVYAHMQEFSPKIKKYVEKIQNRKESFEIQVYPEKDDLIISQGETIGLSGNTGSSGGPHLHFEIRDTKSEHPLNPLRFNFKVQDALAPVISSVKIYAHEGASINETTDPIILQVNKKEGKYKTTHDLITVNGDISFGISTFDRQNASPNNKNGVYSIKLFIDNTLIHHFMVDEISFAETRFINAHIDYKEYMDNNVRYNRCYSLPYNNLSNYYQNVNKGIYTFSDTLLHNIRFEVEDFEKNLSTVDFQVKSSTKIIKKKKTYKKVLKYNESNIYKKDKIKIHMKKYSLYEDCILEYSTSKKRKNSLSETHHVINASTPVQKYYVLSIKEDIPKRLINKSYIAKLNRNGSLSYRGGEWKDGFLSVKIREFGDFCITADTINPFISFKKHVNNIISCNIKDNESGISYYRGELNGNWILMEYEHKKNLLTCVLPKNLKKGSHTLKVFVKDKVNNLSEKSFEFTY